MLTLISDKSTSIFQLFVFKKPVDFVDCVILSSVIACFFNCICLNSWFKVKRACLDEFIYFHLYKWELQAIEKCV